MLRRAALAWLLACAAGVWLLGTLVLGSYELRQAVLHPYRHNTAAANPWIEADPRTSHFVDELGRVRLFHGLNVVFKTPPHIPDPGEWDAETSFGRADAANLSAWGFNAIRLGVLWAGTFPARRGAVDASYVEKVKSIVRTCAEFGIYVVLDMHSDVLSRRFCGNGLPDWAVDEALHASGMNPPHGDFPAPLMIPQSHFFGASAAAWSPANRSSCDAHIERGSWRLLGPQAELAKGQQTVIAADLQDQVTGRVGASGSKVSALPFIEVVPDHVSVEKDGWCAAEIVAAAGARTSTEVAALLDAAGFYPRLEACLERDFFGYYNTNVSTKTAQALYTDKAGLRTAFSEHWAHIAAAVASEPAVLAHDLLNEPWPGDTNNPWEYSSFMSWWYNSPRAEHNVLLPFYRELARGIRKVDQKHIIAYEPIMWDVWTSGFRGDGVDTNHAQEAARAQRSDRIIGEALEPNAQASASSKDGSSSNRWWADGSDAQSGRPREALSWHAYCWWAPNVAPSFSWLCAAYHRHLFAIQAFSARLQRGGSFLSEFGSLGSTPVELAEISRVVAIADEFLVSRFYWQYKNYKDITSSGGYSRLSLYPHDKKLAKEKLRALATPYAQAIAGTPSLMRWDGWWRTLAFEYTAASPRRNGASTVATSGGPGDATEENADADLSRTTVLHVASELHYPEGYAVLISVILPPTTLLGRILHVSKSAFEAVRRALCIGGSPLVMNTSPNELANAPQASGSTGSDTRGHLDPAGVGRGLSIASRVSIDGTSRLLFTHPPEADGQNLFICVVPCDAYHNEYCTGGRLGGRHRGVNGSSPGILRSDGSSSKHGDHAAWLGAWHPCVWRSEVLSLYTILFLSSAMLLLDAFIAVKQLRNHFHASRPAFNAVHLLPSAAFATLVVIQLVVAVVLSGCLYHGDSWRWLVFFVLGPIPLFMIASSTGTQTALVASILGFDLLIWRLGYYFLFHAPGASSTVVFVFYRCAVAVAVALLLLRSSTHLGRRARYRTYIKVSSENNMLRVDESSVADINDEEARGRQPSQEQSYSDTVSYIICGAGRGGNGDTRRGDSDSGSRSGSGSRSVLRSGKGSGSGSGSGSV